MGMYTAISLGVELKKDAPPTVIETLKIMTGHEELLEYADPRAWFGHDLFETNRWQYMLRCDSYYFTYDTNFTFRYDDIAKQWFLSGVSNLKNYGNEISKFLDWLQPFIDNHGWIGWTMYEEDWTPTLLFNDREKNEIVSHKPEIPKELMK